MILGAPLLVLAAALLLTATVVARRTAQPPRSLIVEYLPLRGARVIDDALLAGRERRRRPRCSTSPSAVVSGC